VQVVQEWLEINVAHFESFLFSASRAGSHGENSLSVAVSIGGASRDGMMALLDIYKSINRQTKSTPIPTQLTF
jgi:hypothetical protein